jgi:hypothetical protein
LCEPLKSKITRQFSKEDDTMEELTKEYEPFELDNLDKAKYFKEIATKMLKSNNSCKNQIIDTFNLKRNIPYITKEIETKIINDLFDLYDSFEKYLNKIDINNDREIIKLKDLVINGIKNDYTLIDNDEFIRIIDNDKRIYIPIKHNKKVGYSDMLKMYVISLMDISLIDDGKKYNIELCSNLKVRQKYSLDSKEAKQLLEKIFISFNDFKDNYYFDVSNVDNYYNNIPKYDAIVENYLKLLEQIYGRSGTWKYFDAKKLSNESHIGYNEDTYYDDKTKDSEFDNNLDKQIELLKKLFN